MNCQKLLFKEKIPYLLKTTIQVFFLTFIPCILYSQNLLSGPECASYDPVAKRYFVSCYPAGRIIQIDSAENQSVFISGFSRVLSSTIHNSILYFSTVHGIKGYDISQNPPQEVMSVDISGSTQLDGMVTDTSGNLYVADYDYSGSNDKIFKINLTTHSYSTFVPPGQGLGSPQDLEFDPENNRLIVVNWFTVSPIQAVNLSDSSVTNIVQSATGNFDGIARDTAGNYYISSWATNSVYKYDKNFADQPVVVLSGQNGPANISYNPDKNLIVVPNYNANIINYIQLNSIGIKKIEGSVPDNFRLFQNYPNPFNPSTNIKYQITKNSLVTLKIYDVQGKEISTLINETQSPGTYELNWNAAKYSSGIYFYKMETDNFTDIKKMTLVK